MKDKLESAHRLIGSVAGDICIALTISRVTGGKATLRNWLVKLKEAIKIIEALLSD